MNSTTYVKRYFKSIKWTNDRILQMLFYFIIIVSLVSFIIGNYLESGYYFEQLFYKLQKDSGFDFYVFLSESNIRKDVYSFSEGSAFNPPFLRVVMKFLYRCMPVEIQVMYHDSAITNTNLDIRTMACAILPFVYTFILSNVAIAVTVFKRKKGCLIDKLVFTFICVFSVGMVFAVERGNLIAVSVFFLLVYCLTYNSKNKVLKEIGLISLGIASGIKVYPCILGLLLLKNKDYKAAGRAIIYGIIFLIGPFCFFEGIDGIKGFLASLGNQSQTGIQVGYLNMTSIFSTALKMLKVTDILELNINVLKQITYILCGMGLALSFLFIENWKTISMQILVMILLAGTSHTYMLAFVIIIALFFFNEEKNKRKKDYIYMLLIAGLLAIPPIPTGVYIESLRAEGERFTTLMVIQEIFLFSMFTLLFLEGLKLVVKYFKQTIKLRYKKMKFKE